MTRPQEERGQYWNSYYSAGDIPQLPSQFAVFALSESADADYIIDVGCGNGRDSFFFARHGVKVLSVDYSTAGIEDIRTRATEAGLPINAFSASVGDPELLNQVEAAVKDAGLSGNGVIYARFFIHAITDDEQANFLDFCAAYLKAHGGRVAFEFRTPMDENLAKVTGAHYRRYVDPVDFLAELFKRGLTASYMVQGTGYAKYKNDDAHVVRLLIERQDG